MKGMSKKAGSIAGGKYGKAAGHKGGPGAEKQTGRGPMGVVAEFDKPVNVGAKLTTRNT